MLWKNPPFACLNNADRALDSYSQVYLELEVGDRIKLSRFNNFEVDWRQVEAPDDVKALLDKIEQAAFSDDYTQKLMAQAVEILATNILEKSE